MLRGRCGGSECLADLPCNPAALQVETLTSSAIATVPSRLWWISPSNRLPGELLLLAGASGSGKTTLIRCINGLIPRSYKGELTGRDPDPRAGMQDLPLARISQMVGTVLQDPERQILGTRVRNEVAFGLENLGLDAAEIIERVDQALDYLGIRPLRDRETFNLSGGEKQKVALAGVLAMRPSLLLLDEPLASLDPASAQETLAMVRRLCDEGMTVLMVEHRVEDVLAIRPDRSPVYGRRAHPLPGAGSRVIRCSQLPRDQDPRRHGRSSAPRPSAPPEDGAFVPASRASGRQTASPAAGALRKRQLWLRAPAAEVLHGINLEIRRGDVIAVLGPNGAGKTTLVKHAIGLLKPKAGRVLVNGEDTRQLIGGRRSPTHLGTSSKAPAICCLPRRSRKSWLLAHATWDIAREVIDEEVQKRHRDRPPGRARGRSAAGAVLRPAEARQHRRHPGDALAHPGHGRAHCRAGLPQLYGLHGCHPAAAQFRGHPVHHPRCGPGGHLTPTGCCW